MNTGTASIETLFPETKPEETVALKWKAYLIFLTFMSATIYSLQAPFYPAEAEKKGLSSSEYGFVFGVYPIAAIIFSPFLPYLINKASVYTIFQIAIITIGTTTAIFGFLDLVNSTTWFLLLSIVLRCFEAFCSFSIWTTSMMFAIGMFPKSSGTVFALIQTIYSCGMALGPVIGSGFYTIGAKINFAFPLPFLTLGISLVFLSIFTCCNGLRNLKTSDNNNSKSKLLYEKVEIGYIKLMKVKKLLLYCLPNFGVSLSIGFIDATLEPSLRQFHLSSTGVGLMFLIFGGTFAIWTLLWGYLLDHIFTGKMKAELSTMIGCILVISSYLFLGPVSFLPINPSVGLIGSSLAILGTGKGLMTVSAFTIMLHTGASFGISQADIISFSNTIFGIGAFIGPSFGGWLPQSFGFRKATLLPLIVFLAIGFLLLINSYLEMHERNIKLSSILQDNNTNGTNKEFLDKLLPKTTNKKIGNYDSLGS